MNGGPSLTRQLSYLTSIADSVYSRDRKLLPSLASESDLSGRTLTELELENYNELGSSSGGSYSVYAPPPSPGCDELTPPDMNDFTEFKDEEEEANEIDLLLDSHRPLTQLCVEDECELF